MSPIGRILLIILALFAASLAAGLVVALAVLMPGWSDLGLGSIDQEPFGIFVTFVTIFLSVFAIVPALLLVLISETFGIRSALFYAVAGALAGFAIFLSFGGIDLGALEIQGFTRREAEIMTGAGIVGGLVYWAIAGRRAGGRKAEAVPPAANDVDPR